ncbi:hypothetical protein RHOSPDRAFT_26783 [Rhodotorula sp. JG-1b]|nr:hypothetical protein RHOSPDRAFT_26783 [Rhodotorula sp. JG-1b]
MASDGGTPAADPFPLFHLCDLDFAVSAELLPRLPAFQLALAPWSTAWSPDLEPALKRTWRRKRERARAQITQKAPCGVFAAAADRQKEQFPKFELIPLDFDLSQGEAALDSLTSAQLAAIQFHPSGSKDLAFAAEDLGFLQIFFSRRERDFAAGLSLPPFTPPPTATTSAPAPAVAPAAPAPVPTPAPAAAPTVPAAAVPVQQTSAVPLTVVPAQPSPPAPLAPQPQPTPTLVPTEAPTPVSTVQPPVAAAAAASASSSVAPPAAVPAPAPAPAAQPTPPLSPGTRQRELERAEYRRGINGRHESEDRAAAAASSSSVLQRNGGDRSRSKSRSRSRDRDRLRDRDIEKEREREKEKEREREKERQRERDRQRERERGSRSQRSSRERSTTTRDRDRPRRSSRSREREREREHNRDRDYGRDRDRDRDWERERSPSRRSSHRDRSRSRSLDRSNLSRRLADEKRLFVSLKSVGGDYPNGGEAGSSILSSSSAYRKRSAASPAPSDASLRSSVRRRHDDDAFGGGARRTPPPQMPLPREDLPSDLCASLKTVFMRHFPGQLTPGDVEAWMRTLPPAQSPMAITPIGIKTSHRRNSDQSPNQDPWVTLSFVAFRTDAEAAEVQLRADKQMFGNRVIVASWSRDAGKKSSSWRWSDFTPEFVEEEHSRSLALYAARGSGGGGAGLPPPPTGPLASRLGAMLPPPAPASTSISTAELPTHLVSRIHVLFVTNLPRTTSLEECRNFFDVCDNLVGLALQPPLSEYDFASAWLAFETSKAREHAKRSMYGLQYPGTYKKLWLENAEDRARKTGECYIWVWSNMSKLIRYRFARQDYRQQHAGDHARVRASLPDSPAMNRAAMGGLPSLPPTPYAAAHPVMQRPATAGSFVPNAAYISAAQSYGAAPPSTSISGGSAVENQQQYIATTGSDQTYSPMQPLLASFPPRPPASLVETTPSLYAGLPVPVAEYPTQAAGSAGSHINPARLAMLQASLSAAGFSSPESPEISTNPPPTAATEKMQVDEATRGAWCQFGHGKRGRTVINGSAASRS